LAISREAILWAHRLILGEEATDAVVKEETPLASEARLTRDLLRRCGAFPLAQGAPSGLPAGQTAARLSGMSAGWDLDPQIFHELKSAVVWAYRLFLGRQPESEDVVREKMKVGGRVKLVEAFISSAEFTDRCKGWNDPGDPDGDLPPLPPLHLRKAVGPVEPRFWENPTGAPVFGSDVPASNYESVFDFGCGCGRNARQMMQQLDQPSSYVGIDLNREAIDWCSAHLVPVWRNCRFFHLDAYNAKFNPNSLSNTVAFPTSAKFTLVNAHSVFTHITEPNLDFYLAECSRVLAPKGVFRATWFFFDKTAFPMMQEFQNCLYINLNDPTNATIYDFRFIERKYEQHGLTINKIVPPAVKGFQWVLIASHEEAGGAKASFPEDVAQVGVIRPPV
jgi:SAM-dependent methyltransferase